MNSHLVFEKQELGAAVGYEKSFLGKVWIGCCRWVSESEYVVRAVVSHSIWG